MSTDQGGATDTVEPASATLNSNARQTPGDLLREGREQRGLTVQQIADELHLDVKLVRAIEANNFLLLGAPVYAKGHLRKYASVLGLPADLVIANYETLTDVPAQPTVVPISTAQPLPHRVSLRVPALIVGGLVVAGMLLWLGAWLLDRFGSGQAAATATGQVEIPVSNDPAPAGIPVTALTSPQQQVLPSEGTPVETTSTTAATSGADVSLRLRFTESSWVEIYDAANRRLMYDIGQPGQTRTVAGTAPLRVTLGVASAVAVDVNNQLIPVPRRSDRDATRFTVWPDGTVR